MLYDVFISHASEDKESFVRPLVELLSQAHIEVWYDEMSMEVGDSLRRSIDRGLSNSSFGVVVLSQAFLRKGWPQRELDGLVQREIDEDRSVILPVWHGVTRKQICSYSPSLADSVALNSSMGLRAVADALIRKIRPHQSPLTAARDILIAHGWSPPVISDEWWLDMVEYQENVISEQLRQFRWLFPTPHGYGARGRERGENIASTVLQMDWMEEAEREGYCQLTHPGRIHSFISSAPGLMEAAQRHPDILALYAPQLTIRGFDNGFENIFDDLLASGEGASMRYGRTDTINDVPAACGELVAWRHPSFGNFEDYELAYDFVYASTGQYTRESFDAFECLVWLISSESDWLPDKLRDVLVRGLKRRDYWFRDICGKFTNKFTDGLLGKTRKGFKVTRSVRSDLEFSIEESLKSLGFSADVRKIADGFIEYDFIGGHFDCQENRRRHRG